MFPLQQCRLGVSRRDLGAGGVAGVTALSAVVLFHLLALFRAVVSDPFLVASSFDSAQYLWWDFLTVAPLVGSPALAVIVGTLVWRLGMPDGATPVRGAIAGVVTAAGTLVLLAATFGAVAGAGALNRGPFAAAVADFLFVTLLVLVFGAVIAGPIVLTLGGLSGYAYEWYLDGES